MSESKDLPGKADYTAHESDQTCSFKFSHYGEALSEAVEQGYALTCFRDYDDVPADQKVILLRHDIDFEIGKAVRFAEIEASLGAKATYFVRLHANEYNPFGYKAYYFLRSILEMGHEIGLHFECGDMKQVSGEDEKHLFLKEKRVLEDIFEIDIVSASQHGDYSFYSNPDLRFFFEEHTLEEVGIRCYPFEDRFFKDMKYLSDSNSLWKEGCFCEHIGQHDRMQVLTHPRWWFDRFYHIG